MNVWIINPYGTLPSETWREYRSAMLARALTRRGHEVHWWISDFEHRSKRKRRAGTVAGESDLPSIHVLPTPGYERNISIGRIWHERAFARRLEESAMREAPPDIIVLADPALFYSGTIRRVRHRLGCKLVVDVLDLHPEMFHALVPPVLARLGQLMLAPLRARRRALLRDADGVVAVSSDYLDVVLSGVAPVPAMVSYLGVDLDAFASLHAAAEAPPHPDLLTVIYAGTFGDAYDIDGLLAAIRRSCERALPIRWILAGAGPRQSTIAALAQAFPGQVAYLGSLAPHALLAHYAAAQVGICSYAARTSVAMPVKFYDYLAAGLAVVGSIGGEAGRLIAQGCGLLSRPGDPESLLSALLALRDDPPRLASARARSLAFAREFDERVQHDRFATFLEEIVSSRGDRDASATPHG